MKDIDRLVCSADEQQQLENRKILVGVVHCLLFLAKQNLSLRDHDDDDLPDEDNRSQGNFRSLIQFRIEAGDASLQKHLNQCAKNAMYLSPTIQNELISVAACLVHNELLRELSEGDKFFSIIADESTDITGIQQLSLTVRFLSKTTGVEIKEVFVGFKQLSDLTASGISYVVLKFLHSNGLNMTKIRSRKLIVILLNYSVEIYFPIKVKAIMGPTPCRETKVVFKRLFRTKFHVPSISTAHLIHWT